MTTVIILLWSADDDVINHGIEHWDKPTWDLVQRLLLLDSGADLIIEQRRRWCGSQLAAGGGLIVLTTFAWVFLFPWFLLVLIDGVMSQGITWWDDPAR